MTRLALLFLLAVSSAQVAWAELLPPVGNNELVSVLNNFELIAEVKEPPLALRVLKVQEFGECDGAPETCPEDNLYLAVSEFDEYPNQNAYRLPKRHSWSVVSINGVQKDHVVLTLKAQFPAPHPNWKAKEYEVRVNCTEALISEK